MLALLLAACGSDDPELVNLDDATPTATADDATSDGAAGTDAAPDDQPEADGEPATDDESSTDGGTDTSTTDGDAGTDPDRGTDDDAAADDPSADEDEASADDDTDEPFEPSGDPAFSSASKLTTVGLDTIFFGMTPDEAGRAADTAWDGLPAGATERCFIIRPAGGPNGVSFTVFDGRIERVDITNPDLRTRSGYGVGTTETELVSALGDQLEVTDVDGGRLAIFVPVDENDADLRIVWLIEDGAAARVWAGRVPQVDSLVPCG